jgi:rhamnose transport system permease protein
MTGLRIGRLVLLGAVALLVLGGFASGDVTILSGTNLSSMAVFAVEVGIIAFGQTFVICGGDGGIDLSVGAISGLAEVMTGMLISSGVPWLLAVLAGVAGGAVMGVINGMAVTLLRIPAIIVTLATMFMFNGLALVATSGVNIDLTSASPSFLAIGQGILLGLPFQLLCLYLPILVFLALLQHRGVFGRALYLTGTNALAARLAGIRVDRLRAVTYVISGTLAGIAGII